MLVHEFHDPSLSRWWQDVCKRDIEDCKTNVPNLKRRDKALLIRIMSCFLIIFPLFLISGAFVVKLLVIVSILGLQLACYCMNIFQTTLLYDLIWNSGDWKILRSDVQSVLNLSKCLVLSEPLQHVRWICMSHYDMRVVYLTKFPQIAPPLCFLMLGFIVIELGN